MKELISIIVPVYNVEKYLTECINSLLKQTYKNLEIIIVDDGSTDGSGKMCDEYNEYPQIRVFHRENAGLSASRQFGIDNCNGKYFATIDSDDYIAEDFIEKLYDKIRLSSADICVCGRIDFEDSKENVDVRNLNLPYEEVIVKEDLLESRYLQLCRELVLSDSWNKLYRTEFVRESNVKFQLNNQYNGTDLAFNYKLLMHCPKYCILDEPLLFHRVVQGSRVHRKNKPLQEGFQIIVKQLIDESDKLDIDLSNQVSLVYYSLIAQVFFDITKYASSIKERRERIDKCLEKHHLFIKEHKEICYVDDVSAHKLKRKVILYIARNESLKLKILAEAFLLYKKYVRG